MKKDLYPLAQVLEVKNRRVENAEKHLQLMEMELDRQKKILEEREEERNQTKKHYQEKLDQIRFELDHGTTTDKIQQMKRYLEVVLEELATRQQKVVLQQKEVHRAEEQRNQAKQALIERRKEVDKILEHKKMWTQEVRREGEIVEIRHSDELGNTIYLLQQRRKKEMGL